MWVLASIRVPSLATRMTAPSWQSSCGTVMRISLGMPLWTTSMLVIGETPGSSMEAIWSRLLPRKRSVPPRSTGSGP